MQPLWAWSAAVGCQLPPSLEETTSPTKENRWLWWPRWIAWIINRCQSLRSVQMILFSVTLKLRKPRPSVDLEEPSTSQRSHHPHSTSLTMLLKLNQRGSFVHWSMLQFLIQRFIKLRIVCPSSQSMMGSNQHPRHPVAFINPWGTEERHYLGAWAEIRHGCAIIALCLCSNLKSSKSLRAAILTQPHPRGSQRHTHRREHQFH